jgi:hypothetical protein
VRALILFGVVLVTDYALFEVFVREFARRNLAESEKRGREDWFVHEFEHRDE